MRLNCGGGAIVKVIVVGAGRVGLAIAELLSHEHHEVVLIDRDLSKLEQAAQRLDIGTQQGSGTNWQLLEELIESGSELLLALTDSDETNLVACQIGKDLGIAQTVARVKEELYLKQTRLDFGRLFGVDHFISPKLLAALEVESHLVSLSALHIEAYAHGAVQMRTLAVPPRWKKLGHPLKTLDLPEGVMVGLIHRHRDEKEKIIFPHGEDSFAPNDEVTLVGTTSAMEEIHTFFGLHQKKIRSSVVIGGGLIGRKVAHNLSRKGVETCLIEIDPTRCAALAESLHRVTVLNHDGGDYSYLESEQFHTCDVGVVAAGSDELNTLLSLYLKKLGIPHVITLIASRATATVLEKEGVEMLVSPFAQAASRILALAKKQSVLSDSSLYDHRVKIMEVKVSLRSPIVGIPLAQLGKYLPKECLFAVIQNRGRIMIAHGERILCPGDTTVIITSPKHVQEIVDLF